MSATNFDSKKLVDSKITDTKKLVDSHTPNVGETTKQGSGDDVDAKGFLRGLGSRISKAVTIEGSQFSLDYKMDHSNRGVALIFNHKQFNPRLNLSERRGTDIDRNKLHDLALHLGFTKDNIHVFNDLTFTEVKKQLEFFADRDYSDDDCLLVAMCSHGDKGVLYAKDKKYSSEELWEPFSGEKCPSLAGKPKLFFIQACQGDRIDQGVILDDRIDGSERFYKIPAFADFLIAYSTCPGFYSWRNIQAGSWFMQALYDVLKEHSQDVDLLSMLTFVNHKVAYDFMSNVPGDSRMDQKKQIPCITSMLTRRVIFRQKKIE